MTLWTHIRQITEKIGTRSNIIFPSRSWSMVSLTSILYKFITQRTQRTQKGLTNRLIQNRSYSLWNLIFRCNLALLYVWYHMLALPLNQSPGDRGSGHYMLYVLFILLLDYIYINIRMFPCVIFCIWFAICHFKFFHAIECSQYRWSDWYFSFINTC